MFPEALQHIDEQLFTLINQQGANAFFDRIMPPVRDKFFWIPLYIIIAGAIVWKFRITGLLMIAIILINFAASDQLSSAVIKPAVARLRPCNDPAFSDQVHLRIDACGVGKSFPSSHAVNTFALATMLTLLFRRKYRWVAPLAFFWALLVSYAQIYVGVHYPIDVIAGALIGALIAFILYFAFSRWLFRKHLMEL